MPYNIAPAADESQASQMHEIGRTAERMKWYSHSADPMRVQQWLCSLLHFWSWHTHTYSHIASDLANGWKSCKLYAICGDLGKTLTYTNVCLVTRKMEARVTLKTKGWWWNSTKKERGRENKPRGKRFWTKREKTEREASCSYWCPQGPLFLGHSAHTKHTMHHSEGLSSDCR